MRRKVVVTVIIMICFLLQTTVFQALSFASISPNLLIVAVSSFGFMRGKKEGMFIGFFSGLLIDLFFGECHSLPPDRNKNFSALKKPPCMQGVLFHIPAGSIILRICCYLFYHIQQNNTRAIFSFFAKNLAFYCFA